jgi:hypothetical protein
MTARHTAILILAAALALSACGRRAQLAYPADTPGPATPAGATQPPTAAEQVTPPTQAQPARSDELLKQSDERESDPFDLPPAAR